MKTALPVRLVGIVLFAFLLRCSVAVGQEPPAAVKAPYAGATISDFKGKVGIQLRGQSLTAPSRGEVLPPETTINTDDGRLLLRLSDGSDILVRPHTRILVKEPETNGWRYLQLLIGRIHTQIQKHMGGTPPAQIGTPSAVISVRGTRFDVEVDRRGFTEVDVEEGVVELDSATMRGEGVLITAGFSSRVSMDSAPEVPRPTHDLRPQLDRPGRGEDRGSGDDDPMRRLAAGDPGRHEQPERSGGSSGSDDGERSSGTSGGDRSGSESRDDHSGSSGGSHPGPGTGDHSDDDHHSGKPPGC